MADQRSLFMADLMAAGAEPAMPMSRPTQEQIDLYNYGYTNGQGRLQVGPQQQQQQTQPVLQAQNKRQNAVLSMPSNQIGLDEALIRIGGAGYGGALKGNAITPMTDTYGAIEDYNRSAAIEAYNAQVKAQQDQQTADALQKYRDAQLQLQRDKLTSKNNKPDEDTLGAVAQYDQTIAKMQMALDDINSGMSLTGILDNTLGKAWDTAMGNPEAASRLLLQELKVDAALLNVAQTKGSISNAEMELFLRPTPSDFADEQVWKDWITRRMNAAIAIRNRLARGETVDDPASPELVGQFSQPRGSSAQQSTQNFQFSDEDEDLIARNLPK